MTSHAGHMSTEELFRQHGPFVVRFLARLGVPSEHADDALQEVFLVVHRNGGYRPGIAKPTSYLAGIAVHAASKHRRRERVARARHSEASAELLPSVNADPTRVLQMQQDLTRLQLALDRLPEELRTTLVLVEIEGESCLSVAAALGLPVGTVYSRLHVARKKLQHALHAVDAARTRGRARAVADERRRPANLSSLGMLALFGADPLFQRSDAGQLLRLACKQPSPRDISEAAIARHHELLRAKTSLPHWAAGYAPNAATWLALLGSGGMTALASVGTAGLASAALLFGAAPPPAAPAKLNPMAAAMLLQQAASPAGLHARLMKPATPSNTSNTLAATAMPEVEAVRRTAAPAALSGSAAPHSARHPRSVTTSVHAHDHEPKAPAAVGGDSHHVAAPKNAAHPAPETPAPSPTAVVSVPRRTTAPSERDAAAVARSADEKPTDANSGEQAGEALQEMQTIASAERLLEREPGRALAMARGARARFPKGYLREERAYVEVMALFGLGRTDDAQQRAETFLSTYPNGPYTRRVRTAAQAAR